MAKRKCFPPSVLEMISGIIGDTEKGLTGSEIGRFLAQAHIDETEEDKTITKRKRLYNALARNQNKNQCSNQILKFIQLVLAPSRYVDKQDEFDRLRRGVNNQLVFVG